MSLHPKEMNWIVPLVLRMAVMTRLIRSHVRTASLMSPIYSIWGKISSRIEAIVPPRFPKSVAGAIVAATIILSSLLSPQFEENTTVNGAISLLGYGFCITMLWATSRNLRMVEWRTVIDGMLMQFLLGLLVLRTNVGYNIVN